MDAQQSFEQRRRLTIKIILAVVIVVIIFGIYKCHQFAKYYGEDPAPAKKTKALLANLTEPTPLSEIMAGGEDAYFMYLSPYAGSWNIPCPQFTEEFIKNLDVDPTSSEHITRWVSFDTSGVLEVITFFDGVGIYGIHRPDHPCVKLSEVFWIPDHGLQVVSDTTSWLMQTWSFSETENTDGDEQARYAFDPPNRYDAGEFAEFFAVFAENPHLQLTDVFWPLQVFHIDPEDEGLHVAKTVYYAAPQTYTADKRSLFPTAAERETAGLEYRISLHDARQGPQAAAVLMDADSRMLYIYVFQWHGGWYLLEISDLMN